jgi:hypothetical protein
MNRFLKGGLFSIILCFQISQSMASDPPAPPPQLRPVPSPPPMAPPLGPGGLMSPDHLPLRIMGAGVFQLANLTLNKPDRSVSFPALINMDQGPMEYLLVTAYGKVHESILRTETMPYHIHVAMLLLDATGGSTNVAMAAAPGSPDAKRSAPTISTPGKETLSGDKISIEIRWQLDGKEVTRSAEELISNLETKSLMAKGHWVYNGSHVVAGSFGAQVSGSIVSLITDRESLMNYIGPGHDNDDIWAVRTNSLPPVNTPVTVTLRLQGEAAKK